MTIMRSVVPIFDIYANFEGVVITQCTQLGSPEVAHLHLKWDHSSNYLKQVIQTKRCVHFLADLATNCIVSTELRRTHNASICPLLCKRLATTNGT